MNSTDTTTRVEVKHLHHSHDPETSRIAAESIDRDETSRVQQAILDLLAEEPRADFELIPAYFNLRVENDWPFVQPHSIARRRSELHMLGRVYDTGERRQTPYRRPAVVWAVKEAA